MATLGLVGGVAFQVGAESATEPPRPGEVRPYLTAGATNPLIANGVAIGRDVELYKTSGLGPAALNTAATPGTPKAYVDPAMFPGGKLHGGVTITEAQGLNVLARIGENLAAAGLTYSDVHTMRVFLANPPGKATADFDGWNRAYRQYFANVDLGTGQTVPVVMGTRPAAPPLVANAARPSRFALEIATLPVAGWLVEVEVDAHY
ncbi:hypothetical protein D5H78_11755 [Vallicoccus soli]|uniref:RidA family protein n=1 Tax=Vallicoccus soli TaxID=2339232 RepID=A0A3A3Z4M6_9ACTN|nr:hypothetical protein D5H78_11755 [Vallicoccus soli]